MATSDKTASAGGPRDAAVMEAILKEMGVTDYEPNVIHQMLELSYRYVVNVLEDAKIYSTHANKTEIDESDVRLAIQNRMDHSFTTPPPRDFLIEIARQRNSTPLPLIPEKFGPRLPPERYCLTGANYKVKQNKKESTLSNPQVTLSATLKLPLSSKSPLIQAVTTPTSHSSLSAPPASINNNMPRP